MKFLFFIASTMLIVLISQQSIMGFPMNSDSMEDDTCPKGYEMSKGRCILIKSKPSFGACPEGMEHGEHGICQKIKSDGMTKGTQQRFGACPEGMEHGDHGICQKIISHTVRATTESKDDDLTSNSTPLEITTVVDESAVLHKDQPERFGACPEGMEHGEHGICQKIKSDDTIEVTTMVDENVVLHKDPEQRDGACPEGMEHGEHGICQKIKSHDLIKDTTELPGDDVKSKEGEDITPKEDENVTTKDDIVAPKEDEDVKSKEDKDVKTKDGEDLKTKEDEDLKTKDDIVTPKVDEDVKTKEDEDLKTKDDIVKPKEDKDLKTKDDIVTPKEDEDVKTKEDEDLKTKDDIVKSKEDKDLKTKDDIVKTKEDKDIKTKDDIVKPKHDGADSTDDNLDKKDDDDTQSSKYEIPRGCPEGTKYDDRGYCVEIEPSKLKKLIFDPKSLLQKDGSCPMFYVKDNGKCLYVKSKKELKASLFSTSDDFSRNGVRSKTFGDDSIGSEYILALRDNSCPEGTVYSSFGVCRKNTYPTMSNKVMKADGTCADDYALVDGKCILKKKADLKEIITASKMVKSDSLTTEKPLSDDSHLEVTSESTLSQF